MACPPPGRGMEIFRPAKRRWAMPGSATATAHGWWARCRPAWKLFDLAQPNRAGLGDGAFRHAGAAMSISAASLALAAGGVALRVPKGKAIAAPLTLDFTGAGHVRGAAGAGRRRVADPGRRRRRRRTSAMSASKSCWAQNARLDHVRLSPDAGDAVQVEEIALQPGRATAAIAAISPVSAASCRAWNWRSRWKARAPRRICPACRCWTASAMPTSPPMSSIAVATPTAPNCSSMSRAARRRAVYQGKVTVAKGADGSRQPPDRQGAAAGRRAPKPISSPNWKSSPTTSNAPMARRWAIWMRIRCSICAPAAFRKAEARGLLLHAFLEDAVAEIANDRPARAGAHRAADAR